MVEQLGHDAHRDDPSGPRVLLGGDVLDPDLETAERALDDDLVAVPLDGWIGDDAKLRPVEPDAGKAHRRGDVHALGEAENARSRGAAVELALTGERRRFGLRKERSRGLARRVRHTLDAADRRRTDRVEAGDRSREHAHPRATGAGGRLQLGRERWIGERAGAQDEQIDPGAEQGWPVCAERVVTSRFDDDFRLGRDEVLDGDDDRWPVGASMARRVAHERAHEDDHAGMSLTRDADDAVTDRAEADEAGAHRRRGAHVIAGSTLGARTRR